MRRVRRGKVLVSAAALVVIALLVGLATSDGSVGSAFRRLAPLGGSDAIGTAPAGAPATSTIRLQGSFDGDVRRLPAVPIRPRPEEGEDEEAGPPTFNIIQPSGQTAGQSEVTVTGTMPATATSFDGLAYNFAGTPPDAVGDVGPNHYVEAVNTMVGIYTKAGAKVTEFTFDALWNGIGTTACNGYNYGDPTVVYDTINGRWIVADFAFVDQTNFTPPFYECIAVSKSSDPTAGWWFYAVRGDDATHPWFPDYPKMSIWPGSLLMSANMFTSQFKGVRVWAFNLADLEAGVETPRMQLRDLGTKYFSLLPVNLRGVLPPANTPAYFVSQDTSFYRFDVWKWAIDWGTNTSTWSGPTQASQTSYPLPNGEIVPQQDTTQKLDALDFRLLMQAQYRNVGGVESIWVTHTVNNSPTAVQWAQLNVTGGTIATTPVQQGIWNNGNDGLWRWIPSLAVDQRGNMAVAYSVSSSTMFPAIRYAGRLASDTLSTLGQGETELYGGVSNQIGNIGRWGDYFAMSVDPVDDCTFWFVGEYVSSDEYVRTIDGVAYTRHKWHTRIGSFKFPSCGPIVYRTVSVAKASVQSGAGTVTSSPAGIACGATCSATFADGTSVTLSATAASGSVFTGWTSGPCSGSTSRTCSFTVSGSDVASEAGFATTRTLTVTKVAGSYGTVTSSPAGINCGSVCSFAYSYGTYVTLTATPSRNRGFVGWSGCDTTSGRYCYVTLTSAKTVTATFKSAP